MIRALPVVALIGRPNVGKSTLFNRLVGKSHALVHDQPGFTRDRRYGQAQLGDLTFTVIDTGGLEAQSPEYPLAQQVKQQITQALDEADLVLFIVDGQAELTATDRDCADLLRRSGKPVCLVLNKADLKSAKTLDSDLYALGFGESIAVSAAHNQGFSDLYDALLGTLPLQSVPSKDDPKQIKLCFVGRPNVGKSSLINALLGEDRMITATLAGTTRDAVRIPWTSGGTQFCLIDTAGLRRRSRIDTVIEQTVVRESLRAVDLSEVVLVVIDAMLGIEKQDLTIAAYAAEQGRCVLFLVNKWDQISEAQRPPAQKKLRETLVWEFAQIKNPTLLYVSALSQEGLGAIVPNLLELQTRWNTRLATAPLNSWLAGAIERHPPPRVGGQPLKCKYITQIKSRPPTFALWVNRKSDLPGDYLNYLRNGLGEHFALEGIPLRFVTRITKNPFNLN